MGWLDLSTLLTVCNLKAMRLLPRRQFGLRVVVDRNFAADTVIVGDASGFEIFEQQKGALSLESPSTLSRTLSFHGYFSTLMIDSTKFVKLT